jgi:transcriptional regulator with XRE-family HTH domain
MNYLDFKKQMLENPEVRREYCDLLPEMDICQAMIRMRSENGLTQKELADRTGIPQADISRLENMTKNPSLKLLKKLAEEIGAGKIVVTSPENHDKMIAYTSQLAHIVSSAYVKSPELGLECGFSGGSFQDMTRIATMNERMWTDLFMQNRDNLQYELDTLIENLLKYSDALKSGNAEKMKALIAEGRELKEENLRHRVGQPN